MKITILILLPPPEQQEQEACLQPSSAWLHSPSPEHDEAPRNGHRRETRGGKPGRRVLPPGVGQN